MAFPHAAVRALVISAQASKTSARWVRILGGEVMAARVEGLADQAMGGEELLRLARRFTPLHLPFSSSGELVGVLGSIIEIAALPVLDTLENLLLGRPVG